MDESSWLTSNDPAALLSKLERVHASYEKRNRVPPQAWHISPRKLRLWCAACLEASGAGMAARSVLGPEVPLANWTDADDPRPHFVDVNGLALKWSADDGLEPTQDLKASYLRDIVGNPFRPVYVVQTRAEDTARRLGHLAPEWLTPNVLALARAAYADRDWGLLVPLADALEEAGCTDAALLDHCRGTEPNYIPCRRKTCHGGVIMTNATGTRRCQDCGGKRYLIDPERPTRGPGPHARGCWVLDLILGRE